jgi:hypothetical protein
VEGTRTPKLKPKQKPKSGKGEKEIKKKNLIHRRPACGGAPVPSSPAAIENLKGRDK